MATDIRVDRNGMIMLTKQQCMHRLGHTGLGRIGISVGALPAIFPINYVVDGEDIYFLTAPGTKLAAASRNAVVAFEVDEADRMAHTGWSVLVVGRAEEVVDPDELARLHELPLARWLRSGPVSVVRITGELVSGRQIVPVAPLRRAPSDV